FGYAVGNALEMEEAILMRQGEGPEDLREVVLVLAAEMLVLGGVAADGERARDDAAAALADGRALQRMAAIIEAQGGNPVVLEDPAVLPQAPVRRVLEARSEEHTSELQSRENLVCRLLLEKKNK